MNRPILDAFTRAYLHAMAFTETPDDRMTPGEYPEPDYARMFTRELLADAVRDCERFQERCRDLYMDHLQSLSDEEHAGRDFWYTRNGHGCGFWDGDWPKDIGEKLTDAAKSFGEYYVEYRRKKFRKG